MFGQVALLRELAAAFFGNELVLLLAISVWMISTGAGAFFERNRDRAATRIAASAAVLGFLFPAAALLARALPVLLRAAPGAYLPLEQQALVLVLVVSPVAFLLGALFVAAARAGLAARGSYATAYGVESLGGVAGGLASTFLVAGRLPALSTLFLCAALSFFAAVLVLRRPGRMRFTFRLLGMTAIGVLLFAGGEIDRATARWNHPDLVESRDTRYGRLTLVERSGQFVLFENGSLAIDSESDAPEEIVHIAMIQRESPESVLILGGGERSVEETRKHGDVRIDRVETDRVRAGLVRRFFDGRTGGVSETSGDPRVRLVIDDPRAFVRQTSDRYDVLIVDAAGPVSGGANRLYTEGFFTECARLLGEEGVLAFRLPSPGEIWTETVARRNGSIHRALASVFPERVVLPGASTLFLASAAPLERDPAALSSRLAERGIGGGLVSPPYVEYLYTNDRFREIEESLRSSRAPANSDLRPICYPLTTLLWLSRFQPGIAGGGGEPGVRSFWLALIPVAGLFLLARRKRSLPPAFLVALAGFAGILIEFAVILRFQSASGVLYSEIGLLLAGFMAGLALSPFAGKKAAALRRGGGATLLIALAIVSLLSVPFFRGALSGRISLCFLWLLLTGVVIGGIYCYASEKNRFAGAALYGADLLGGAVGALLASLLFLPFLGLPLTAAWAAALALSGLLLLEAD